ncbi:MAG: sialidase family protein [Candidatus Udaeobacter sp.]
MKKKSTSQSAFFNLRVLIGLFIVLAGVFLALIGFGTFSGLTANSVQAQQRPTIIDVPGLPPGFDCAQVSALGIDKQENLRAGLIMIACGLSEGGSPSPYGDWLLNQVTAPLAYGGVDIDLITGADLIAHPTQSETYTLANPNNPNQIVVTYNDSRTASANYSGASYSSDGGATFTRLNPAPFASGHGTNFGDPVTLYNTPTSTFFAVFLATGCGGQGIGAWKSTDGGVTWSVGACVHTGSSDDRESGVADTNASSPFFGRMYVSWNNFAVGSGALQVTFSTDNGATWHAPINVSNTSTFIRDVQITVDKVTGDVYVAGMNEGGGGLAGPRSNKIYRSTDGGVTWTNTYTGPNFSAPGRANCSANSYFVCMYSPDTWRHMGWGEPAAYNHIVSLVYAQHGAGADPGDVYYIRSTDSGATFGAPLKLNTDTTTRLQWQPNLSVSDTGTLFSVWYDERGTTSCAVGNPAVPCYQMFARESTDNGVTWLADMAFSDVISPLPGQPDGTVQPNYQGDYDYGTATASKHYSSWDDGRVTISGQSQQDVFTDKEPTGGATPTPTPTATPSATPTATPAGIPCGDLVSFQVRCKHTVNGDRLQAKLTLTNTSHSGQQVTITVDGNPNQVTINGNKAQLQIANEPLGQHTVALTDPAGCFAPVITNCN